MNVDESDSLGTAREGQHTGEHFAIAVTCLDGRVQAPARQWTGERFQARYIDVVTAHAPEALLAQSDAGLTRELRRQVAHAVETHGARDLALVGHAGCEVGPHAEGARAAVIQRAVERIASWGLPLRTVVGVMLDHDGAPRAIAHVEAPAN